MPRVPVDAYDARALMTATCRDFAELAHAFWFEVFGREP